MGKVQEVLNDSMKQQQRLVPTEDMLKQLRPWLEYRKVTAHNIERWPYDDQVKEAILKQIEHCDKNIKELLGL